MISDSDELDLELKRSKMESCNIHTHTDTHICGADGELDQSVQRVWFLEGFGPNSHPFPCSSVFFKGNIGQVFSRHVLWDYTRSPSKRNCWWEGFSQREGCNFVISRSHVLWNWVDHWLVLKILIRLHSALEQSMIWPIISAGLVWTLMH